MVLRLETPAGEIVIQPAKAGRCDPSRVKAWQVEQAAKNRDPPQDR